MKNPIPDGKPWHSGTEPIPRENRSVVAVAKGIVHQGSGNEVAQFLERTTVVAWCYESDLVAWVSA